MRQKGYSMSNKAKITTTFASVSDDLLSAGVIIQMQTVAQTIMEPSMVLAYDPWDNLHQLWKDRFSDKTEWRKIESILATERKLGISR